MTTAIRPEDTVIWAASPVTSRLYHALPRHYRGRGVCDANTRGRDGRTRLAQPVIPLPAQQCRTCVARLEANA